MAWQDVDKAEWDGNAWTLRFNAKYGDFNVRTTGGRIMMSVEDGRITVCITGIGYVDPAECADYANALLHASEAAIGFQRIMDDYANHGRLNIGK